jgi:cytochrome c oxidase subunit 2
VQKGWSILFGVVLFGAFAMFAVAPFVNWWLPRDISTYGHETDFLFFLILGMTGFFFVLCSVIQVWCMWRYAGRPGHKGFYTHGSHKLEMFWTLVPAVLLLVIAFAQVRAWANIKYQSRMPDPEQVFEVSARQFEWRVRYPRAHKLQELVGSWKSDPKATEGWVRSAQSDDVQVVNEVHVWKGAKVRFFLKTRDVLHSFFLPNMRLKQDAVPGKTIPVWFEATRSNTQKQGGRWVDGYDPDSKQFDVRTQIWELACAELCGWGHTRMAGRLYVHETKEDFDQWLEQAAAEQDRRTLATAENRQ